MEHIDHIQDELRGPAKELRALIPDVLKGFGEIQRAAMMEGATSLAQKELIALAIAMTRECDGCIGAHARGAVKAGVTREQLAETIGVVILMNGGPGTVWGPRALRAFDEAKSGAEN
jgi:AhpD family alkylhydroperoxidase